MFLSLSRSFLERVQFDMLFALGWLRLENPLRQSESKLHDFKQTEYKHHVVTAWRKGEAVCYKAKTCATSQDLIET